MRRDAFNEDKGERRLRLIELGHMAVAGHKPVEEKRTCEWHRVLVGRAAASMRYHDEIRVSSRLMAKSVVGNNQ